MHLLLKYFFLRMQNNNMAAYTKYMNVKFYHKQAYTFCMKYYV
jgi:hypothetical protein